MSRIAVYNIEGKRLDEFGDFIVVPVHPKNVAAMNEAKTEAAARAILEVFLGSCTPMEWGALPERLKERARAAARAAHAVIEHSQL